MEQSATAGHPEVTAYNPPPQLDAALAAANDARGRACQRGAEGGLPLLRLAADLLRALAPLPAGLDPLPQHLL